MKYKLYKYELNKKKYHKKCLERNVDSLNKEFMAEIFNQNISEINRRAIFFISKDFPYENSYFNFYLDWVEFQ